MSYEDVWENPWAWLTYTMAINIGTNKGNYMTQRKQVKKDRQKVFEGVQTRHGAVNMYSKRGLMVVHRFQRSYYGVGHAL